ncbi:MAG: ATP-dependent Clp protease proteolytic subunit [Prevotellaceae bacterium]|jgi:membrane-bound serine protease (ClpP class)|nr:ATP-dependent Clp protease proteolytic subunit [Prevotellaceae bacterium]
MKPFFLLLSLLLLSEKTICKGEELPFVYKIAIKQEIHQASQRALIKGLKRANDANADYIILQINTYGGAMDAADSMRTAILHQKIPVIAFIDNQAASAGALISIACDSIYMSAGATFGSATVVDGSGKVLPEKYQSFMRSMMRSTAESHGKKRVVRDGKTVEVWHRDPSIAESMVGKDTLHVLNFTTEEAILNNYCEGKAQNIEEVISLMGIQECRFEEYTPTALDRIIGFFLLPVIQGLLIMLIIGGIYFELQTPGIGFPLVLAIGAALLYFLPLYMEGIAQYWELLMVIVGVVLIFVEIFLTPGFGFLGICGIVLFAAGLVLAMIDNSLFRFPGPFNWGLLVKPISTVAISGFVSVAGLLYLVNRIYPSRLFNTIALRTELDGNTGFVGVTVSEPTLIGSEATVFSDLKPAGKVLLNNKLYEASAAYGMISKGSEVKIVRMEGGRLYCEPIALI